MNKVYEDIRVLDLSDEKGMYCGKLLAFMGADVVLVEPPEGSPVRKTGPLAKDIEGTEKSLLFAYLNTGKKSITLDLYSKEGAEKFRELAADADVILESSVPGTMEALELGYDDIKKINPGIIYASITPFGQTGVHSKWKASSDIITYGMGGPMFERGKANYPPLSLGHNITNNISSMHCLLGIMAAIHARNESGIGEHIDVSVQESSAQWRTFAIGEYQIPPYKNCDREHQTDGVRPSGFIKCKDGSSVYVTAAHNWEDMLAWTEEKGTDVTEFKDPKYLPRGGYNEQRKIDNDRIMEKFSELGKIYTAVELMEEGQRRRIPIGIVHTPKDTMEDAHFQSRQSFKEIDHPVLGTLKYAGAPFRLSESPLDDTSRAPLLGENNDQYIHRS